MEAKAHLRMLLHEEKERLMHACMFSGHDFCHRFFCWSHDFFLSLNLVAEKKGSCPLSHASVATSSLTFSPSSTTTTHRHTMTRATEAATFFGITATLYLALLFQWLPITLPKTVQEFTLPVVSNIILSFLLTGRRNNGTKWAGSGGPMRRLCQKAILINQCHGILIKWMDGRMTTAKRCRIWGSII